MDYGIRASALNNEKARGEKMPDREGILNAVLSTIVNMNWSDILNLRIIFLSIIIEALPFILLGVFVSALINQFVSEQLIQRLLPKNRLYSIIPACFLGVLFPVCDCAIVPIVRRLITKGVPLPAGIAFMLAAPVINPVVASATAFAFNTQAVMWLRLSMAFVVAAGVALCLGYCFRGSGLKLQFNLQYHSQPCGCGQHHSHSRQTGYDRCFNVLADVCDEFFEMGRFLIFGALFSAIAQTLIPSAVMMGIGKDPDSSIPSMMVFAFLVSVCSTADAFIAASFSGTFTLASLLAFMTFGPMIDLKNTFMLFHTFRFRLVIALILLTSILCWASAYLLNIFLTEGLII
ncbi:Putative two-component membrane permease complex subunit [Sporomusa rhizae]|uniref:permease n=1 Tax=Sporomusa rhizae TaxID=357999 RepID=UPI00352A41F2